MLLCQSFFFFRVVFKPHHNMTIRQSQTTKQQQRPTHQHLSKHEVGKFLFHSFFSHKIEKVKEIKDSRLYPKSKIETNKNTDPVPNKHRQSILDQDQTNFSQNRNKDQPFKPNDTFLIQ